MKNLLAAYEPDLMVIRIKEDLEALTNRDGIIVPFKDMEEVSVFFHEWIHFIHNTSTLIGLTLFYSYIGLWKIFRYSYANGLAGEVGLNDDLKKQFNNMLKFMGGIRSSSNEKRLNNKKIKDISILKHEVLVEKYDDFESGSIKCFVEISGNENSTNNLEVAFRTHEILENCAFLLEKSLIRDSLENQFEDDSAEIVPYRIIEIFIEYRVEGLSNSEKICCMIASLQSPNPPFALDKLMEFILDAKKLDTLKDFKIIDIIKYWSSEQIKKNEVFVSNIIDNIENSFPINEPIGNSIKHVLKTFINNINYRKDDGFFELEIIDKCKENIINFNEAIEKYRGCTIIKENLGDPDSLNKDIMYSLLYGAQSEDWQIFYSAMKFIKAHIKNNGFKSTSNITNKCPFYTVCSLNLRLNEPEICASTPWEAEKLEGSRELCWYAWGVRQTRPQI